MQNNLILIPSQNDLLPIKIVERAAIFYTITGLFAVLFFYGSHPPVIGGFLAGSIVGLLNFRFLRRLVVRLLDGTGSPHGRLGFVFFIKFTGLLAVAGFLILKAHINALAFMSGFSAVVFGIFYEGVRSLLHGTRV